VQRLWQQARLQVRKQSRKRRHQHTTKKAPLQANYPGHVWSYDFVKDQTQNGVPLRILTVMDEFTREGLAIEVASSMPAQRVIAVLERFQLQPDGVDIVLLVAGAEQSLCYGAKGVVLPIPRDELANASAVVLLVHVQPPWPEPRAHTG
jgi:hypothetical protein